MAKDPNIYWNYVRRTTIKEIEAYKKLYGSKYEGTIEASILQSDLDKAMSHITEIID